MQNFEKAAPENTIKNTEQHELSAEQVKNLSQKRKEDIKNLTLRENINASNTENPDQYLERSLGKLSKKESDKIKQDLKASIATDQLLAKVMHETTGHFGSNAINTFSSELFS